ncbi:hypothetical protein [Maribacter sp. R77961]|uniref:hypothetical protein n=1 Tax=Maribacter sp. R77961 TaxID=3093871 RepID=UPI0037CAA4D7
MHENLKYTVRLTEKIKACADIKQANSIGIKDWQPIFADKEYDTFYFLYAKFIGKKDEDGECFNLNKIQFYLQNFEGEVTIGLTGKAYFYEQELDPADHDTRYEGRKQYGLFIILQGFNSSLTSVKENDLVFPNKGLWSSKPKINSGDVLVTRVYFRPIPLHLRNTSDNQNPIVLDRLFQARDGDSVADIERQDRSDLKELVDRKIMKQEDYEEIFKDLKREALDLRGVRRRCSPIISFFTVE